MLYILVSLLIINVSLILYVSIKCTVKFGNELNFRLVSRLYILTSSLSAASLCILTSSWLARHTLLYLVKVFFLGF